MNLLLADMERLEQSIATSYLALEHQIRNPYHLIENNLGHRIQWAKKLRLEHILAVNLIPGNAMDGLSGVKNMTEQDMLEAWEFFSIKVKEILLSELMQLKSEARDSNSTQPQPDTEIQELFISTHKIIQNLEQNLDKMEGLGEPQKSQAYDQVKQIQSVESQAGTGNHSLRFRFTQLEHKIQEVEGKYAVKLYLSQTELSSTQKELARIKQTAVHPPDQPDAGLSKQVLAHVGSFLARQDLAHLRRIFDRHAGASVSAGGQPAIVREQLRPALEELGVLVLDDTVDDVFATMDTDGDEGVDFYEFAAAVARPSRVEQWTDCIAVDRLLASALGPVVLAHSGGGGGGDVLRALSRCSEIPRLVLIMDCWGNCGKI